MHKKRWLIFGALLVGLSGAIVALLVYFGGGIARESDERRRFEYQLLPALWGYLPPDTAGLHLIPLLWGVKPLPETSLGLFDIFDNGKIVLVCEKEGDHHFTRLCMRHNRETGRSYRVAVKSWPSR